MPEVGLRRAEQADVARIVELIAEDQLGDSRDHPGPPLPAEYMVAFHAIDVDPHQLLLVAVIEDEVIGTAQLSFLPGLARRGAWRMQIEAVRVAQEHRGKGIGRWMTNRCIEEARARGCRLVQLTSNVSRADAHRFYASMGFIDSHVGFKLRLEPGTQT